MKNILFVLILFIASIEGFSQVKLEKLDVRFGAGTSLLGSGDFLTAMFENEVNYKLNYLFTISPNISYGKSDFGVALSASFIQFNLNFFISPFKNNKKNDFRVGGGISRYSVSDVSQTGTFRDERGQVLGPFAEF